MQVIEAKHDAITLELEDELRLDAVFRPPLPGSAKKIKAGEVSWLEQSRHPIVVVDTPSPSSDHALGLPVLNGSRKQFEPGFFK